MDKKHNLYSKFNALSLSELDNTVGGNILKNVTDYIKNKIIFVTP